MPVKNLPSDFEGFTILHLTDLHSKEIGKNQSRLLDLIDEHEYDLIVLTGDMIYRKPDPLPVEQLIEGLQGKPVFFVPGNHEYRAGYDDLRRALADLGVYVLENDAFKYRYKESHIWILGVDDPNLGFASLDQALANVTNSAPAVLLSHAPNIFPYAVKENIDLVLTGHTHGGQIRFPLIGAVFIPDQELFPEYDYGLFASGNTIMAINAGLGESIVPLRFLMQPEIVFIRLIAK